ncbi:hypothetical protein ABMA70_15250 [Halobacteriovorax sp. XZX-3]|uniref:hypothetical protein n=1 Tax=unclassified Halobacteriovorax TaxID=2639665 RepID=UPI000CD2B524|nr:hypothetical protein [Halobacteriovorax sp. DA5]POB12693.1 hypothetical protein C0Z22_14505 [Halobacteriovorax sp. DA5]
MIKFLLPILVLVTTSCSLLVPPQKRDYHGRKERTSQRQHFTGVKKKVALLTFFNESPFGGQDLGVIATEELRRELQKTGQFIVDPMSARLFGSSKQVYSQGGSKLVQMTRKAKGEGVNFVIFGRIIEARVREKSDEVGFVRSTKSYSEAKVEIRIYDVNSNKEIYTDTLDGYADDSSYRFFKSDRDSQTKYRQDLLRYVTKVSVRKSIPRILDTAQKLEWIGRVAKIIGNNIYINAGRDSGLNIGDVLKVVTEGVDIYDPETGALIGVSKGEVKGTIEIIDFIGADASIGILHSGGSVHEGDFVKLY